MDPTLKQTYETFINQTIRGEDPSATLSTLIAQKLSAVAADTGVSLELMDYIKDHKDNSPSVQE